MKVGAGIISQCTFVEIHQSFTACVLSKTDDNMEKTEMILDVGDGLFLNVS